MKRKRMEDVEPKFVQHPVLDKFSTVVESHRHKYCYDPFYNQLMQTIKAHDLFRLQKMLFARVPSTIISDLKNLGLRTIFTSLLRNVITSHDYDLVDIMIQYGLGTVSPEHSQILLATTLFAIRFGKKTIFHHRIRQWITTIMKQHNYNNNHDFLHHCWCHFYVLFTNNGDGGDPNVWSLAYRSCQRLELIKRLFTKNKQQLKYLYIPVFYAEAYNADVIDILANDCHMIVSKQQMIPFIFKSKCNAKLSETVLIKILLSWRNVDYISMDFEEIHRLLYIRDRVQRAKLMDIITSAAPCQALTASQLSQLYEPFHNENALTDSCLPFMHVTVNPVLKKMPSSSLIINDDFQKWRWQLFCMTWKQHQEYRVVRRNAFIKEMLQVFWLPPELFALTLDFIIIVWRQKYSVVC